MALPSTGSISMGQVRTELGASGAISLGQTSVRTLAGRSSGSISMSHLRGKSSKICQNVTKTIATQTTTQTTTKMVIVLSELSLVPTANLTSKTYKQIKFTEVARVTAVLNSGGMGYRTGSRDHNGRDVVHTADFTLTASGKTETCRGHYTIATLRTLGS